MDNLLCIFLCVVIVPFNACALNVTSNVEFIRKDEIQNILRHYDVQIDKLQNVTDLLKHHVTTLQQENENLKINITIHQMEKEQELKALKDTISSQNNTIVSLTAGLSAALKTKPFCPADQEIRRNFSIIRNDISGLLGSVSSNKQLLTSLRDDLIYVDQERVGLQNKTEMLNSVVTSLQSMVKSLGSKDETVGFSAFNSKFISGLGDNQIIVFDQVTTQYGSGYEPSKGTFTAQRAGMYAFFADIRNRVTQPTVCWIEIVKNGYSLGNIFLRTKTTQSTDSTLAIVSLATGDKIWVRKKRYTWKADDPCTVDDHNTFSGFLLFSK